MEAEEPSAQVAPAESRLDRLKRAFDFAFQRVEPQSEIPEMPRELGDWGRNTALTMFAGICFLAARQYASLRRLGPYRPQQPGLSKAQEAKLIAEENTRRLLRLTGEGIRGGVQFGSLAGLFYGSQLLSGIANGGRSISDTVFAGSLTGGVLGAFLPGHVGAKLRSSVLAAAMGAAAGFPVALLQMKVDELMQQEEGPSGTPDEGAAAAPRRQYPEIRGDPAEAVIRQLEAGLRK